MTRRTYEAIAQRDGKFWLVRVPAVDRSTQALRLDQAEGMVRDLVAIMTGEPEDSFDVRVSTSLEPELEALLREVGAAKAEAAENQKIASAMQRLAVERLTERGFTVRDAGQLLGLTYQRISQLRAEQKARHGA